MPTNYRLGLVLREGRNFEDHDLLIDWYKQLPRNEHGEIHRDVLQRHLMAAMVAYVAGELAQARPKFTPRPFITSVEPPAVEPAREEVATPPALSVAKVSLEPQAEEGPSRLGFDDTSSAPKIKRRVSLGQVATSLKG